jgi:DNA-binding MarR family transcriptional regulator
MEKEDLVKKVMELQRKVDRVRRQYGVDVWMGLPITIAQLKSLWFISSRGSCNSSELATALKVTPTNITGIIDRLVKQGLVSREEDAEDRRKLLLRVTDKGEELLDKLRERRKGRLSEVLSRMTPEELNTLAQGYSFLIKAQDDQETQNR